MLTITQYANANNNAIINAQPIAKCSKVKENQVYWRADAKAYPPTSHHIAMSDRAMGGGTAGDGGGGGTGPPQYFLRLSLCL